MLIRPATVDDAPAMARVFVDAFHAGHAGQLPPHLLATRTYEISEAGWRRTLADGPVDHLTVAESAGSLLGICLCGPATPWEPLDVLPGPVAECFVLYVDPPRQRQGVGQALLAEASESLASKAFRTLVIGVLTTNEPARAFYERLGGLELGHRIHLDEGIPLPESVYVWHD